MERRDCCGLIAAVGSVLRPTAANVSMPLRTQLMAPDLVAEFITAFTAEWNRLAAEASAARDGITRDLATTERKLKGLIDAIADGFRAPGLQAQLNELDAKRVSLTAKLDAPAPTVPRLHPNLAEMYRAKVQTIQDALAANPSIKAALEAARALIERIELKPAATERATRSS